MGIEEKINSDNEIITTTKEELVNLIKELSVLNVSTLLNKFKEMEDNLEIKIDKMISENYCSSALTIIEEVKKQEEIEKQKLFDKRLRNAKYLFKNFNNLKEHYKNAVYLENELAEDEKLTDIYDFIDEDNEKIMIQSIYRSKRRTEIMITHIEVCVGTFIQNAYNSGKLGKIAEADVVNHIILENKTIEETAELMNYNPRSISRIIKKAIEQDLAVLIFGVDAIRLDR